MSSQAIECAVDIGGTFTDVVLVDGQGLVHTAKVPTTYPDQGIGATNGIQVAMAAAQQEPTKVRHGTTAVINAILERKGALTGFVTTTGMRDLLDIGRGNRTRPYKLAYRHPDPFVRPQHRVEVEERVDGMGQVVRDLDPSFVETLADLVEDAGLESLAVSLLNSYRNPVHELQVKNALEERFPDLFVTVGTDLSREWREFERSTTAVLNAYVGPMATRYLRGLQHGLDSLQAPPSLYLMQSSGGMLEVTEAQSKPILLMESGPVAGIIAAGELGARHGYDNVIAFDMGGTTAKAAIVFGGEPYVETRYYVGGYEDGYPLQAPIVDVLEVGTGGGSLAWCDDVGALHVGPRSAGSEPGPACYDRGGDLPTVTDANLLLGRLAPDNFLGGAMKLREDLAVNAMENVDLDQLGLDTTALSNGIIKLANVTMGNALRRVTIERGHDPRDFVMVAYGGAGPLHAVALARELGVPKVLIPNSPGHFSAVGMLTAPLRRDFSRTIVRELADDSVGEIAEVIDTLREDASAWLTDKSGTPHESIVGEARYVGQEHTVQIGLTYPADRGASDWVAQSIREFRDRYLQRHGHLSSDGAVELVSIRLVCSIPSEVKGDELVSDELPPDEGPHPTSTHRRVFFDEEGWVDAAIVERSKCPAGMTLGGPFILEEVASTTVGAPGCQLRVLEDGAIEISL